MPTVLAISQTMYLSPLSMISLLLRYCNIFNRLYASVKFSSASTNCLLRYVMWPNKLPPIQYKICFNDREIPSFLRTFCTLLFLQYSQHVFEPFCLPEPKARGELLWSLGVRLPSSVIRRQQLLQRTSAVFLNYWLDFAKTYQEWSWSVMALFNNCTNGFGPLHI